MYKLSPYNFIIPVEKYNNYLIYNSLSNKMFELDYKTGRFLYDWYHNGNKDKDIPKLTIDNVHELINEHFIISHDFDEKQHFLNAMQVFRQKFLQTGTIALTLLPTYNCNMACPYCFEGENKPAGIMSSKVMDNIIVLLKKEIISNPNRFSKIHVTWFGGEPLCARQVIEKLSEKLISLTNDHGLKYSSNIITNGVNLSNDTWQLLQKCKIKSVQITIDGNRELHNKNRPLKGKKTDSFDIILNNLKNVPDNIKVQIRINADKSVFKVIPNLFTELNQYGIWPKNINNVYLYLGYKFSIDADNKSTDNFTREEFASIDEKFSKMKMAFYNKWAKKNNIKQSKLAFKYPSKPNYYCITANHPYAMTIDYEGNIHKCWEYCNSNAQRIANISEGYDYIISRKSFKEAIQFDKVKFDEECRMCKFLPICEVGVCMSKHLDNQQEKPCTPWKYRLEERLKQQYIMTIEEPDKIQSFEEAFGEMTEKANEQSENEITKKRCE